MPPIKMRFLIFLCSLWCSSLSSMPDLSSKLRKVCRVCKLAYVDVENSRISCKFHRGRWIGAENSKHMGTKSGGFNTGLSLFWDCCEEESINAVGCTSGHHKSYDDDDRSANSFLLIFQESREL